MKGCLGSSLLLTILLHFFIFGAAGAYTIEEVLQKFSSVEPGEWGQEVRGVATGFAHEGKEIALTFDACGGPKGSAVDWELLEFLNKEAVPATLFFSGRWLAKNESTARELAKDPLFEIGNHGLEHRPLSVSGKSAYGIKGTPSIAGVVAEVEENALLLEKITGKRPKYFRSGTNHYDEVAVAAALELGHRTVGYSHNGDGGATYRKETIVKGLLSLKGGEIVLFHMNRPDGWTAEGVKEAIPLLRERGFRFIRLSDRPLSPELRH